MLTDREIEQIYLGKMLDDHTAGGNGNGSNGNGRKKDPPLEASDLSELAHEQLERIVLGLTLS